MKEIKNLRLEGYFERKYNTVLERPVLTRSDVVSVKNTIEMKITFATRFLMKKYTQVEVSTSLCIGFVKGVIHLDCKVTNTSRASPKYRVFEKVGVYGIGISSSEGLTNRYNMENFVNFLFCNQIGYMLLRSKR